MIGQLAIAGLQVAKAVGDYNQSKSQARQIREQSKQAAKARAQEIRALAAEQRASYLASGLELEGTPMSVINDTYNTGLEDITAIGTSAKTQMKNTLRQGRSSLLGGFASAGVSLYGAYNEYNKPSDIKPDTKRNVKFK